MAKERMITRTINVTVCEVMAVDTITAEVSITTRELTGKSYTVDVALKDLKKLYETDTYKIVAIQSITDREEMYGISEIEFLKVAKKLNPVTRKALEIEAE